MALLYEETEDGMSRNHREQRDSTRLVSKLELQTLWEKNRRKSDYSKFKWVKISWHKAFKITRLLDLWSIIIKTCRHRLTIRKIRRHFSLFIFSFHTWQSNFVIHCCYFLLVWSVHWFYGKAPPVWGWPWSLLHRKLLRSRAIRGEKKGCFFFFLIF